MGLHREDQKVSDQPLSWITQSPGPRPQRKTPDPSAQLSQCTASMPASCREAATTPHIRPCNLQAPFCLQTHPSPVTSVTLWDIYWKGRVDHGVFNQPLSWTAQFLSPRTQGITLAPLSTFLPRNPPPETSVVPWDPDSDCTKQAKSSSLRQRNKLQGIDQEAKKLNAPVERRNG